MVELNHFIKAKKSIIRKARKIKFVLTDVDGVLTDTGVYYSDKGEELKRFSIRDGMGVELLRTKANIETGIITGENSAIVTKRAEKLKIENVILGCKDKKAALIDLMEKLNLEAKQIAYIGDDVNDIEIMNAVGLSACPDDAIPKIKKIADFICNSKGGYGAFREFADFIIKSQLEKKRSKNNEK